MIDFLVINVTVPTDKADYFIFLVINVTLPDDKANYLHRIGRVGRAERMGLAISFVSTVKEKVWYHQCPSKGKNCDDTRLTTEGGCCIWYNESQVLIFLNYSRLLGWSHRFWERG